MTLIFLQLQFFCFTIRNILLLDWAWLFGQCRICVDGEYSYSCAICSKGFFKDISRKVERDTFPDLKKAPVGKNRNSVFSIEDKIAAVTWNHSIWINPIQSKVILVGLKSDLKNDEETKKKLAEKEKVNQWKTCSSGNIWQKKGFPAKKAKLIKAFQHVNSFPSRVLWLTRERRQWPRLSELGNTSRRPRRPTLGSRRSLRQQLGLPLRANRLEHRVDCVTNV